MPAAPEPSAAGPESAYSHPEMRRLRHDMMGNLNALKLTATLVPMLDGKEALEYLDAIEGQVDQLLERLDSVEALLEELGSTGNPGAA